MSFTWGQRTYIMGIINATPDSFSGDGVLDDDFIPRAVKQAQQFVSDGADVLDIGGESTRPGSVPVTADEEMARAIPAIRAIREANPDVTISIDTYRASVAEAALRAGADWVNDVWGLRMDPGMAGVVAAADCPVIVMHNRSKPKDVAQERRLGGRYIGVQYDDLVRDIHRELEEQVEMALNAGVAQEQIIIDPGIGFGKTVDQNLELIDRLGELKSLGRPILIGPSRKSFIGFTLDLPPGERMEGTAAAVAIGIDRGADIIRVHDVRALARVARLTDGIVRRKASPVNQRQDNHTVE
ncbi:MAG: dihydropteroate synthase [Chloroflexota bacterium]